MSMSFGRPGVGRPDSLEAVADRAEAVGGMAVSVLVGGEEFRATPDAPFVFGRADAPGIIGLDPNDMGISSEAGSVECEWGVWWIVNRSSKRRLLVEDPAGASPMRIDCGHRFAITVPRLGVLVPGAVYTHRLEVILPGDAVAALGVPRRASSGTITSEGAALSEKDRGVLTAMFNGYLRPFPQYDPRPVTYRRAAELLGPPWTQTTVRRQLDRIKERWAKAGHFFDGPRANDDFADYLVRELILTRQDLARLVRPGNDD
jgi:hypothetical protein